MEKNYLKNSLINKTNIEAIFICLLLFTTQLFFDVPNRFSVTNIAKVNGAIITLSILAVYFVVGRICINKDYKLLTKNGKNIFWLCVLLGVYFLISIVIRYFMTGTWTVSVSMTQTVIFAATFYLMIEIQKIEYDAILRGFNIFITIINLSTLIKLIITKNPIRTSGLLSNINVYIGLIFILSPILIYYCLKRFDNFFYKAFLFFNMFSVLSIFILSGSRFGLFALVFELLIVFIIVKKPGVNIKGIVATIILSVFVISFASIFYFSNKQIKEDIYRTFAIPIALMAQLTGDENSSDFNNTSIDDILNNDLDLDLSNPDIDLSGNDGVVRSLTRNIIYSRTFSVLKKHWLIGTGRQSIYFFGWGYQSPHNHFLETLVCYGVIGGIIYLALAYYLVIQVLRKLLRHKNNQLFIVGFVFLFLFSMVEPLLADKILILLAVWGIGGSITILNKKESIFYE